MNVVATSRARARIEITAAIKDVARRHLAAQGAAALSLRAVARELELSSSAVYRYFPSRDELLTALIIDAFDALGEAAEKADARHDPNDFAGRWLVVCRAVRRWARWHPHEYMLLYGSPVPGYAAPPDTIAPATRVGAAMARILQEAAVSGVLPPAVASVAAESGLADDALALQQSLLAGVPLPTVLAAIAAWTQVFGLVTFELTGQFHNVIDHHEQFFDHTCRVIGRSLGLPSP
jgi:AcrR family transcriptional regulator